MPQSNESELKLRDLRALEVMLTEGSLTRAATRLNTVKMPPISVAQYWHARYHQDPGHRWLRQTCFGLFGGSA
jgi:DNA-binding transcriptional LysR family regulator